MPPRGEGCKLCHSAIIQRAYNTIKKYKRYPISGAYQPNGEFSILINGHWLPAIKLLQYELGTNEAWNCLKQMGCAFSAVIDQHLITTSVD